MPRVKKGPPWQWSHAEVVDVVCIEGRESQEDQKASLELHSPHVLCTERQRQRRFQCT